MGGHLVPAFHHWLQMTIGQTPLRLMQFALTTLVLAGPGAVFYRLGIPALLRRAPDMNSLVVLGTSAAWAWSVVVTFAPTAVPEAGRHVYFEAAAVIVTLILLGRWLEACARGRAGAAIAGSDRAAPGHRAAARRHRHRADVSLDEVVPGDRLLLRPGARVAVDGIVRETGDSHVDEAMLTGEPIPVGEGPGDARDRGHRERQRQPDLPRHGGRRRYGAVADRRDGGRRAIRAPAGAIADRPGHGSSSCPWCSPSRCWPVACGSCSAAIRLGPWW
jgi:Cu+-exporting ATPase